MYMHCKMFIIFCLQNEAHSNTSDILNCMLIHVEWLFYLCTSVYEEKQKKLWVEMHIKQHHRIA